MSVVDKPIVDRKLVLAQVASSSTYFDLLGLPANTDLDGTDAPFQGVMKRWSFAGFRATHGTHEYRRHPGAIG